MEMMMEKCGGTPQVQSQYHVHKTVDVLLQIELPHQYRIQPNKMENEEGERGYLRTVYHAQLAQETVQGME